VPEAGLHQRQQDSEKESHYRASDHDEAAFREGSLVGRNGGIDDLDERALLGLVELGNLKLSRQNFKDCLIVFYVAQLADVFEACFGNLALGTISPSLAVSSEPPSLANCARMLSNSRWACTNWAFSRLHTSPSLNLHFPGCDLRSQSRGRFDQGARLAAEFNQPRGLLGLLQCLLGVGQVVLRLLEFPFEEEPALRGFRDSKMLRQIAELVDIAVGQLRGAPRVAILDGDMDQVGLAAAVNSRMLLEGLERIGEIPLVVLLHQAEMLHHRVLNRAAPDMATYMSLGFLSPRLPPASAAMPPMEPSCEASAAPIEVFCWGGSSVTVAV